MKKIISALVFLLFVCLQTQAQQTKAMAYIEKYKNIAIAEMQRSGVPAAITLAQGMLESSYGESELCKKSNNHFGIKCKNDWTGDKAYSDDDVKNECFRVYADVAASYKDHSDFLRSRDWYAPLFNLSPTDVEGWAYGLKKAGYATEKDYPQRLLELINRYNLNQYTLAAMQQNKTIGDDAVAKNNIVDTVQQSLEPADNAIEDTADIEDEDVVVLSNPIHHQTQNKIASAYSNTNYPQGVFSINNTKTIYVPAGTSLLLLATEHHVYLSKLIEYNELNETDILQKDDLIFLERKQKKGDKDFHVVAANETLHDICQKEGVRIDCIMQYNNIKKNTEPVTGEKIYLKATAPVNPKTVLVSVDNSSLKNSL